MMNKVAWDYVPLEDLIEVHDGQRKPVTANDRIQGQTPYCGANGVVDYVDGYTHDGEYLLLAEDGGRYGPGERSAYVMTGKFWANNHAHVLSPRSDRINLYYLLHYLNFSDLTSFLKGATRPKLNQGDMRKIPVLLPSPDNYALSIDIQNRLVFRLDSIFSELSGARRLHDKIVTDTNRLMDAVLAEVLPNPEKGLPEGWGALPLSQLASEESNQIIPSDHPSDTFNYWGLDAISEGQIAEPLPNYIQGSDIKSTCVSFSSNHVLYSKLRPYLNKVIVPSIDGIGSTEWVVYRPNSKLIRREYLAFVLRTKWFVNLASGSSYGARMPRANKSVLREIKIPIPFILDPIKSLSIQEQIIERISQFSSDVDSMQKGNAQQERLLAQLEQSILAQAFRGEL